MSTIFEANKIVEDKMYRGQTYYCVEWKNTVTNNVDVYKCFKKDMKNVIKMNQKYIIEWENTWVKYEELKEGCDEILNAYLLLKLYNFNK